MMIVGGVVVGASSFGFRAIADHRLMGLPRELFTTQYSLGFVFLGLLVLLLWRAGTEIGKIGLSTMTFAITVALIFPPFPLTRIESILINLVYIGLVVGGGVFYYRISDPANTIIIAGVSVMALEHYLFALTYAIMGFIEMGRPTFAVAVLFITVILYSVRNVLGEELKKTQDTSDLAQNLRKVLT